MSPKSVLVIAGWGARSAGFSEAGWARIKPWCRKPRGGPIRGVIVARWSRGSFSANPKARYRAPHHLQFIPHPGACGKARVVAHNRRPKRLNLRNGSFEMRMLLSTYGSGPAMQSRVLGAEARVCAAPVATDVMPTGGWR
jgi:hypothetical protein